MLGIKFAVEFIFLNQRCPTYLGRWARPGLWVSSWARSGPGHGAVAMATAAVVAVTTAAAMLSVAATAMGQAGAGQQMAVLYSPCSPAC